MNKKSAKRSGLIIFLLCFGVLFFQLSMVETKANEYNVIRQFGKVVKVVDSPGLSFKVPFVQSVSSVPKTVLLYDLPLSDVITKDKKTMVADSFAIWKIEDPLKFIKSLDGRVINAESRISNIVYNSMKNVISSLTQAEVISGRDGKLALTIKKNIGETFHQYGINLIAVETKHLDLPDDNKEAVYERMISERGNIAASYAAEGESEAKKIRTETDKNIAIQLSEAEAKAAKIKAQGEAEYMKILSNAYGNKEKAEFYTFVRSLDGAKKSLANGKDKTLILSKDSPLAQVFNEGP